MPKSRIISTGLTGPVNQDVLSSDEVLKGRTAKRAKRGVKTEPAASPEEVVNTMLDDLDDDTIEELLHLLGWKQDAELRWVDPMNGERFASSSNAYEVVKSRQNNTLFGTLR